MTGGIVIILMGVFPPFTYTFSLLSTNQSKPAGYSLIISPPKPEKDAPAYGIRLDTSRLIVQWAIVAIATGIGVLLSQKRRTE